MGLQYKKPLKHLKATPEYKERYEELFGDKPLILDVTKKKRKRYGIPK